MYPFIESIKLLDGKFYRINLHQSRVNRIFSTFFPKITPFNLTTLLKQENIPDIGLYKTRFVFNEDKYTIEFIPYLLPSTKTIKLIETNIESTFYKSTEREKINKAFLLKENCDDVLLVKNGLITDCSYSNVAFYDGVKWFTPAIPIIYGTQRAYLLEKKIIVEKNIPKNEIHTYQQICLFNAMIEFKEVLLPTSTLKI